MEASALSMPIIGLQCTLLAIFIVVALPHTFWTGAVFPLLFVGTLFTIGWAVAPKEMDTE